MATTAEAQDQFIELANKALNYRHAERDHVFCFAVIFCVIGVGFLLGEVIANVRSRRKDATAGDPNGIDVTVGLDPKSLAIRNLTAGGLLVVLATILQLSLVWSQLKQTVTDTTRPANGIPPGGHDGGKDAPVNPDKNVPENDTSVARERSITLAYSGEWKPDECDKAMADLDRLVYPNSPKRTRDNGERLEKFKAQVQECKDRTLPSMIAGLKELQAKEGAASGRTEALGTVIKNLEDMQAYLAGVAKSGNVTTLLEGGERSKLRAWIDSLSKLKNAASSPPAAEPPARADVPDESKETIEK